MKRPTVVLVLGLPASGKSTLARKLSEKLNLPLLVKDDIKLMLFDAYDAKNREDSMRAGRAAYEIMRYIIEEQLKAGHSLIVESTFNPDFASSTFQALQERYGVKYLQIWCHADPDVLRQRFKARNLLVEARHVSHIEAEAGLKNLETMLARGFAPLRIEGEVIKVDTTDFSKLDEAGIVRYTEEVTKELPKTS